MKRIITFLFLSILIQSFAFCQTQEELDLEMEKDLNEDRIKVATEEKNIFKLARNLPRFPGCESQGKSKKELEKCSETEMLKFIYSYIKYPKKVREEGTDVGKKSKE